MVSLTIARYFYFKANIRKAVYIVSKMVDITGKAFGDLTVLERYGKSDDGKTKWLCQCACGNYTVVLGQRLRNGTTKSCGCRRVSANQTHGMYKTRMYRIWQAMRARCYNPKRKGYKHYGGRGIKVCDKWESFEGFFEDMHEGYTDGLSIDRIDVNGNYCKENCRWATQRTQSNNQRKNVIVEIKGESHTVSEWAVISSIPRATIQKRMRIGWENNDLLNKVDPDYRIKNLAGR